MLESDEMIYEEVYSVSDLKLVCADNDDKWQRSWRYSDTSNEQRVSR